MKVLVCGGREFTDYNTLSTVLDSLPFTPTLIIQGGARGADRLAQRWAIENSIHSAEVRALWDSLGKQAGHERNVAMLLLKPEYVVAFSGGVGTADMIRLAKAQGLPVWQPLLT